MDVMTTRQICALMLRINYSFVAIPEDAISDNEPREDNPDERINRESLSDSAIIYLVCINIIISSIHSDTFIIVKL